MWMSLRVCACTVVATVVVCVCVCVCERERERETERERDVSQLALSFETQRDRLTPVSNMAAVNQWEKELS